LSRRGELAVVDGVVDGVGVATDVDGAGPASTTVTVSSGAGGPPYFEAGLQPAIASVLAATTTTVVAVRTVLQNGHAESPTRT
jgi:hypothetical protein